MICSNDAHLVSVILLYFIAANFSITRPCKLQLLTHTVTWLTNTINNCDNFILLLLFVTWLLLLRCWKRCSKTHGVEIDDGNQNLLSFIYFMKIIKNEWWVDCFLVTVFSRLFMMKKRRLTSLGWLEWEYRQIVVNLGWKFGVSSFTSVWKCWVSVT